MHLPIFYDGQMVRSLIIGGGASVNRKIELLLEAGAAVNVIAPQADFKIIVLASLSRVKWEQRSFDLEEATDYDLVVIGKEDVPNKAEIVARLRHKNIPVNVCGDPDLSTIYFPAVLREGEMTVAVSSGGQAPFMALEFIRRLKMAVKGWGSWLKLASRFRSAVEKSIKAPEKRQEYYEKFIHSGPVEIKPLPAEKTTLTEWLQILRLARRPPNVTRTPASAARPSKTGFLPRSTYEAGYSAVETDDIPPPDEVGVFTHDAPTWEARTAPGPENDQAVESTEDVPPKPEAKPEPE